MDYLKQIDTVLFYFQKKAEFGGSLKSNEIWNALQVIPSIGINDQTIFENILDRLEEDGFIKEESSNKEYTLYHITFKGLLFHGYENEKALADQQSKEMALQRVRTSEIEEMTYKNGTRMYYLTWILAIGTSIAAIYYLMEIGKYLVSICRCSQ